MTASNLHLFLVRIGQTPKKGHVSFLDFGTALLSCPLVLFPPVAVNVHSSAWELKCQISWLLRELSAVANQSCWENPAELRPRPELLPQTTERRSSAINFIISPSPGVHNLMTCWVFCKWSRATFCSEFQELWAMDFWIIGFLNALALQCYFPLWIIKSLWRSIMFVSPFWSPVPYLLTVMDANSSEIIYAKVFRDFQEQVWLPNLEATLKTFTESTGRATPLKIIWTKCWECFVISALVIVVDETRTPPPPVCLCIGLTTATPQCVCWTFAFGPLMGSNTSRLWKHPFFLAEYQGTYR